MIDVYCDRCLSHNDKIERNRMDIQELRKAVSSIKNWVMAGAASLILHLVVVIFKIATHSV